MDGLMALLSAHLHEIEDDRLLSCSVLDILSPYYCLKFN